MCPVFGALLFPVQKGDELSMSKTDPPAGRRRYERIRASLPVRLSTLDPELDPATGDPCFQALETRTENVSSGGALLHCTEVIAPGRRVLAEILLASGAWAEPIGRVAWASNADPGEDTGVRLGIEFLAEVPEVVAGIAA